MASTTTNWVRGRILGRGSTATVSLATSATATFAVKSAEIASAAALIRERDLLSSLSSPHLLAFLGSDVTFEHGRTLLNLHLEYAPGGSIHDRLRRAGALGDADVAALARSILLALSYLHSRGVAHCDVKPRNVVLAADGSARLVDFGCARRVGSAAATVGGGGTPLYMPPEAARGEEQGTAADVWALGCTVLEMATGRSPWPGATDAAAVLHRVGFGGESPEIPAHLPPLCREFIARCLERDPRRRPAAVELLRHPFVACAEPCVEPVWRSPKSVMDRDVWESSAEEEEERTSRDEPGTSTGSSLPDRIGDLVGPGAECGWADDDEWATVRVDGGSTGHVAPDEISLLAQKFVSSSFCDYSHRVPVIKSADLFNQGIICSV